MNKNDKQIIYSACDLLGRKRCVHSCTAILRAHPGSFWEKRKLKGRYSEFYQKAAYKSWFDDHASSEKTNKNRNTRILLLMFFAHCEGKRI